jgi:hypothetical protein
LKGGDKGSKKDAGKYELITLKENNMERHRKGIFAYITIMLFMLQILGAPPLIGIASAQTPTSIKVPGDARAFGLESLKIAIANDGGVPLPKNLKSIVKDFDELLVLGKALFWDMRVGSDNVQACASCHFHAGADNRARNQLHPHSDSCTELLTRLQSFRYVQAPRFAHHPGRSHRSSTPAELGSRDFYFRAPHGSLPPRVPDILAV